MNKQQQIKISKLLSLILRHKPETIGLTLNPNGWANVDELLLKINKKQLLITKTDLEHIVKTNTKNRFSFNDDYTLIRANQGHSLKTIDLQLQPLQPPQSLYHGTVLKFIESIKKIGLQKQSRQHVHLSADTNTAITVAKRRGKPVLLTINTAKMHEDGYTFYCSNNGVWLTDHVPAQYINF